MIGSLEPVLGAVSPAKDAAVLAAAVGGGFVNAIAGGGSLPPSPALLWVGAAASVALGLRPLQ